MSIIYLLTNLVNGKRYVGKTSRSLEVRWQGHLGSARRGDSDMLVCRAIKKHGSNAFKREVLEEYTDERLGETEKFWISLLGTHVSQGGYNLTFGGDGGLPGYKFSDESREKIRQKVLGRKLSPEACAKISAAHKGRSRSPEEVEARRQKLIGQKRTEMQRARISEGLKGHVVSEETRIKLSIAGQQRVTSEETKQKLRESCLGWSHSEETRKRISAARSRAVIQFDERDTLIGEYPSIKEAARLSGKASVSISRSLASGRFIAGCRWQYRD